MDGLTIFIFLYVVLVTFVDIRVTKNVHRQMREKGHKL